MTQLRCEDCGKLWSWEGTSVTPEDRCGVRLSSDVWCDGTMIEHQCGGPREACRLRGCEECGGESLTSIAELRISVAQLTRERDDALARVAELEAERNEALAHLAMHYADASGTLPERMRDVGDAIGTALVSVAVAEQERDALRARVAELEAPPVAPNGQRPPHADEAPEYCWHCHLQLEPERPHCEDCPEVCEDQDCPTCGGADLR